MNFEKKQFEKAIEQQVYMKNISHDKAEQILKNYDYANLLANSLTYDELMSLIENADEDKKQMLKSFLKDLK